MNKLKKLSQINEDRPSAEFNKVCLGETVALILDIKSVLLS